jgi:Helix-turn-helix domain
MSALLSVVPVSSPAVKDNNNHASYEGFESFVDEFVVASFLKITPRRVLEMARNGELPAHPIGHERKTWRFRLSEIDAHFGSPKKSVSVTMPAAVPGARKRN